MVVKEALNVYIHPPRGLDALEMAQGHVAKKGRLSRYSDSYYKDKQTGRETVLTLNWELRSW